MTTLMECNLGMSGDLVYVNLSQILYARPKDDGTVIQFIGNEKIFVKNFDIDMLHILRKDEQGTGLSGSYQIG